jgi:hypothetical protein
MGYFSECSIEQSVLTADSAVTVIALSLSLSPHSSVFVQWSAAKSDNEANLFS